MFGIGCQPDRRVYAVVIQGLTQERIGLRRIRSDAVSILLSFETSRSTGARWMERGGSTSGFGERWLIGPVDGRFCAKPQRARKVLVRRTRAEWYLQQTVRMDDARVSDADNEAGATLLVVRRTAADAATHWRESEEVRWWDWSYTPGINKGLLEQQIIQLDR